MKNAPKSKTHRPTQPKIRPVYIRVGAVVQKDGSLRLVLDERVSSLTIVGPFPKVNPTDEEIPF